MELLFLRHGPAEPKADWSGEDIERPLSVHGRLLVVEVAALLARYPDRPELVLTSPYERARETAQIVAAHLGMADKVVVDTRLAPGFGLKLLGKVLNDHAGCQSLLLVGHGPDFSEVVRALTGGRLTIQKAGVARVDVIDRAAAKGRLLSLIVPAPSAYGDHSAHDSDN